MDFPDPNRFHGLARFWMTPVKKIGREHGSVLDKPRAPKKTNVSRAGKKLEAALTAFEIDVRGKICADFGSNTGGFVEALLKAGATKVFAVEKGYGVLDWSLRQDPRVVTLEKTDARRVVLPQKVDLITSDTGWTRLEQILPSIARNLLPNGSAIVLVKPHYEATRDELDHGTAVPVALPAIEQRVMLILEQSGFVRSNKITSPIKGEKGGNVEWLWHLTRD